MIARAVVPVGRDGFDDPGACIWPSSFDMALRIRALGSEGELVADGRFSVVMRLDATDSAVAIPRIRRGLLAVEAAAFDYC